MTKNDFMNSLPKRENIYVIFSRLTNLPYVECNGETFDDEVFLYADEAAAIEQAKILSASKQPAAILKVEKKNILKLFADFYVYGITRLVIREGKDELRLPLSQLLRRPRLDKLPPKQRPLENPGLQMSMIYYLQEARKAGADLNSDFISELEEEMAVNLIRAKYLLPIKEVEMDGKKMTQILMMKNKDGEVMVPVFTDGVEYNRFQKDQGMKAAVTDFEKLAEVPMPGEVKGFLLNPAGAALVLTRDYLKKELQLNR